MPNSKRRYVPVARQQKRQAGNVEKQRLIHERRQRLLSLRQAGASYAEIVRANIGYNSTAHVTQDMRVVLEEFQYETPEDVLVLDLARLDEMQKLLTAEMRAGDVKGTIPVILRVMQFRRETLGITPEQIAERSLNKTNISNNGIMVVQGTTGDYISAMAQAVGADPSMIKGELEKVAQSNQKLDIIDAEIINDETINKETAYKETVNKKTAHKKRKYKIVSSANSRSTDSVPTESKSFERRLLDSAERRDREDTRNESQRAVGPLEPLLTIDAGLGLDESETLSVPIKPYDHNVSPVGIPYQTPPRKITPQESRKLVLRKLKKPYAEKGGVEKDTVETDTVEKETIQEIIE